MTQAILTVTSKSAVLWSTFGLVSLIGLIAVISPARFANIASWSSRWVDTNRLFAVFDRRIDIDRHVLPFSRLLGFAVLAAVAVLAYVLSRFV